MPHPAHYWPRAVTCEEEQENKATKLDRRNKLKGPAATEQSRHVRQEKDHVESPPVKKKRGLTTAHHEDKGIEKEKKELKRLEKLLSIRGGKEEKEKKFPNSLMRDGLDCILFVGVMIDL